MIPPSFGQGPGAAAAYLVHLQRQGEARMQSSARTRNYGSGWRQYVTYSRALGIDPRPSSSASVNSAILAHFTEHNLSRQSQAPGATGCIRPSTASAMNAAVKHHWRVMGGGHVPLLRRDASSLLIAAAQAASAGVVRERRAFTHTMLVACSSWPIHVYAPIATGYHLFLRPGEIAQTKDLAFCHRNILRPACIRFSPTFDRVHLTMLWRKNKGVVGKTATLTRFSDPANPAVCIVRILRDYLAWRGARATVTPLPEAGHGDECDFGGGPPAGSALEALFVAPDGRPVQVSDLRRHVKQAARACGLNARFYSGQSLRIGAARVSRGAGWALVRIMAEGMWRSFDGVKPYLRDDPTGALIDGVDHWLTSTRPPRRCTSAEQAAEAAVLSSRKRKRTAAFDDDDDDGDADSLDDPSDSDDDEDEDVHPSEASAGSPVANPPPSTT